MENRGDRVYRSALKSAAEDPGAREHSVAELSQKLVRRGYEEETVRQVVAECRRLNYLDDRRAADQLIDRLQRRGLGMRRIRHELEKRGLDDRQAEAWPGSASSTPNPTTAPPAARWNGSSAVCESGS